MKSNSKQAKPHQSRVAVDTEQLAFVENLSKKTKITQAKDYTEYRKPLNELISGQAALARSFKLLTEGISSYQARQQETYQLLIELTQFKPSECTPAKISEADLAQSSLVDKFDTSLDHQTEPDVPPLLSAREARNEQADSPWQLTVLDILPQTKYKAHDRGVESLGESKTSRAAKPIAASSFHPEGGWEIPSGLLKTADTLAQLAMTHEEPKAALTLASFELGIPEHKQGQPMVDNADYTERVETRAKTLLLNNIIPLTCTDKRIDMLNSLLEGKQDSINFTSAYFILTDYYSGLLTLPADLSLDEAQRDKFVNGLAQVRTKLEAMTFDVIDSSFRWQVDIERCFKNLNRTLLIVAQVYRDIGCLKSAKESLPDKIALNDKFAAQADLISQTRQFVKDIVILVRDGVTAMRNVGGVEVGAVFSSASSLLLNCYYLLEYQGNNNIAERSKAQQIALDNAELQLMLLNLLHEINANSLLLNNGNILLRLEKIFNVINASQSARNANTNHLFLNRYFTFKFLLSTSIARLLEQKTTTDIDLSKLESLFNYLLNMNANVANYAELVSYLCGPSASAEIYDLSMIGKIPLNLVHLLEHCLCLLVHNGHMALAMTIWRNYLPAAYRNVLNIIKEDFDANITKDTESVILTLLQGINEKLAFLPVAINTYAWNIPQLGQEAEQHALKDDNAKATVLAAAPLAEIEQQPIQPPAPPTTANQVSKEETQFDAEQRKLADFARYLKKHSEHLKRFDLGDKHKAARQPVLTIVNGEYTYYLVTNYSTKFPMYIALDEQIFDKEKDSLMKNKFSSLVSEPKMTRETNGQGIKFEGGKIYLKALGDKGDIRIIGHIQAPPKDHNDKLFILFDELYTHKTKERMQKTNPNRLFANVKPQKSESEPGSELQQISKLKR